MERIVAPRIFAHPIIVLMRACSLQVRRGFDIDPLRKRGFDEEARDVRRVVVRALVLGGEKGEGSARIVRPVGQEAWRAPLLVELVAMRGGRADRTPPRWAALAEKRCAPLDHHAASFSRSSTLEW